MAGLAPPKDLAQRIAAQQAEATHTRTRLIEIIRDGSDGRSAIEEAMEVNETATPSLQHAEQKVAESRESIQSFEATARAAQANADKAAARGDTAGAEEAHERAEKFTAYAQQERGHLSAAETRLEQVQAMNAAADQAELALREQRNTLDDRWNRAESELDKYEQQNALLVKAQTTFVQAERTGDPATAAAAQALLDQADAIEVDRDAIRMEVSEFAAVAPTDLDEVERNFDPPHSLGEDTEPDLVPDQTNPDLDPNLILDMTNPDGALADPVPDQTNPVQPTTGSTTPPGTPAPGPDGVIDLGEIDDIVIPAGAAASGPVGPIVPDPDVNPNPTPAPGPDGVIDLGEIDDIPLPAGAGASGPAEDFEPPPLFHADPLHADLTDVPLTSSVTSPDGSGLSIEIGEATIEPNLADQSAGSGAAGYIDPESGRLFVEPPPEDGPNVAEQAAGSAAVGYIDPDTGKLYVEPQQEPEYEIEVGPAQVEPTPQYEIEIGPAHIEPAGAAGTPAPPAPEDPLAPVATDPVDFPDTPSIDPSIPGLGDDPSFGSYDEPAYEEVAVDGPVDSYEAPSYESSYEQVSYEEPASTEEEW